MIVAAKAVGDRFFARLSIQAFVAAVPVFFAELVQGEATKWRSKVATLGWLCDYMDRVCDLDRDLLSASLSTILPPISAVLYDTKTEVAEAAERATTTAMKGITNRDIEPFIPSLIAAMKDRDQTNETIMRLSSVVFVQIVDSSALAVVSPLMIAGLRQPNVNIRRICCRIVGNMAKLVEEPLEAAPFLVELLPAFDSAIETIADPEARSVATKTREGMVLIKEKAAAEDLSKAGRKPEVITKWLSERLVRAAAFTDPKPHAPALQHLAAIAAALIMTKTVDQDEWRAETERYLDALCAGQGTSLWSELRAECVRAIGLEMTEDVADAETELCNCEFTVSIPVRFSS